VLAPIIVPLLGCISNCNALMAVASGPWEYSCLNGIPGQDAAVNNGFEKFHTNPYHKQRGRGAFESSKLYYKPGK
jgi:hypothetical protein